MTLTGLIKGKRLKKLFCHLTGGIEIADAEVKILIPSVDIRSGDTIVFTNMIEGKLSPSALQLEHVRWEKLGRLCDVMMASSSVPAVFSPQKIGPYCLVDGGVTNNLPVDLMAMAGEKNVIAVDIGADYEMPHDHSIMEIASHSFSIMSRDLKECKSSREILLLKPELPAGAPWLVDSSSIFCSFYGKIETNRLEGTIMKMKEMHFTGTKNPLERAYESKHRKVSRKAAAEGFVLLKNENGILPVSKGSRIALYGAGASKTIKGGTGSGDVNERNVVSIYEGLKNAGYEITTTGWIEDFDRRYKNAREEWKQEIWKKSAAMSADEGLNLFLAYSETPFRMPAGSIPEKTDTDTAIYVLSRVAGEGADRFNRECDYQLSEEEHEILKTICDLYDHVIVLVNTGGLVELSFMDEFHNIEGLLQMVQPGMEAGNSVADVISGNVNPGGKLTDSWAYRYEDYPNSASFSHNNGNVDTERYEEGIYVGYRYFDTFDVPVRYCFGYGKSYTDFEMKTMGIEHFDLGTDQPSIGVKVQVTNVGSHFAGREVVEIYVSCPQEQMAKEYRRLAGFKKTRLLAPGEMEEVVVRFPLYGLASYCERIPGWVLEKGCYGIFVGSSLEEADFSASLILDTDIVMEETEHICPIEETVTELVAPAEKVAAKRAAWEESVQAYPSIHIKDSDVVTKKAVYGTAQSRIPENVAEFVDSLTVDQLIALATGDPAKGQGSNLGSAGITVPGSAAQTSSCAEDRNLASIVLADGPAGLRLNKFYQVENGAVVPMPFEMSLEGGFLCKKEISRSGDTWYQYCTAMPVGTLLAQSWDPDLIYEVGQAVAEEMQEFGVTLWLAPGMNIHRNPLCGRNFEYYSEDPLLTGLIAAAMTKGVQSEPGCGTTIKHFACNNQEDNRMGSNTVISERTLREIYLKGFEIAVKTSQPMSIMTSYNLINGIHAANNYDLCTKAARDEWNFGGVIMTDWTTTHNGPDCTASGCMRAGNDIVMPGIPADHENLRAELEAGTLTIEELKLSIAHLVKIIWQSNRYEDVECYRP